MEEELENPDLFTSQYQAKTHCLDHQLSDLESSDSDNTSDEDLVQEWLRLDQIVDSVT